MKKLFFIIIGLKSFSCVWWNRLTNTPKREEIKYCENLSLTRKTRRILLKRTRQLHSGWPGIWTVSDIQCKNIIINIFLYTDLILNVFYIITQYHKKRCERYSGEWLPQSSCPTDLLFMFRNNKNFFFLFCNFMMFFRCVYENKLSILQIHQKFILQIFINSFFLL